MYNLAKPVLKMASRVLNIFIAYFFFQQDKISTLAAQLVSILLLLIVLYIIEQGRKVNGNKSPLPVQWFYKF